MNIYYVDVGVMSTKHTKLSEIAFSDVNRPYNFPSFAIAPYMSERESTNNYLNIIPYAEFAFGADYNVFYCLPYGTNTRYDIYKEIVPSFNLSFPNSFENELVKSNSQFYLYVKFRSLNKVLIGNHISSSKSLVELYSIDGDNLNLIKTSNNVGYNLPLAFEGTDYGLMLAGFTGSLDNPTYYYGRVSYWTSPRLWDVRVEEITGQWVEFLDAIFRGTTPDLTDESDDPYGPGGNSGEGDLPPGTFDDTSDAIPDSSLPTISAADTGFTRIYNPTLAQVQSLARYLWTDDTVLDTIWNHIKQFFEDPMQAIIGFNLVPCRVPDGGTRSFALMYIDTGVQMTAAASQFVDVDCGTVKLDRYYGSALDQNPYTKISCYLPYIGTVHLDTDEVMGTTLQVKYRIDIVSGSCVAKILVDGNVLYQYSGHCAITIPISSADFASYVSAAVSVGAVAAGLAAGAAAGFGVGAAESEALTVTSAEMSAPITASEASALIGGGSATGVATGASFNGINAANITNTVGQVMGSKLQIEHAGSFSGNSGYLGVRRPYLIINRPNMCLPSLYGHLNGYPSMITLMLGECTGFTKVQQVQLTGVTATNPEQSEILQFLKSGVYL